MFNQQLMLSDVEILLRLFLAAILGGMIGLERERGSWFAGLRTHMLVCMGSTLFMIVSQYGFNGILQKELVVLDPSRISAQVASGIGFLGAGTILFWKNAIRGLTTAASLWAVAAVGLSIGGGLYLAGVGMTIMIFIVLAGIKPLEKIFFKKKFISEIRFAIAPKISLIALDEILQKSALRLANLQVEILKDKEVIHLFFYSNLGSESIVIIEALKNLPGIEKIETYESDKVDIQSGSSS
ncbi:uncharacterized protein YhiD [Parachlamydia acanthamoebae UV-7]|jgi:putative Mg2+ transporter-C (MgtC) family protein|uniref:Uncharacterized protein YhiD n=2 Tax=Parachlamydia acanthamoebae TaxID=83552 RepID=F8L004_PARAV|nr:MgtC/SapB family protein [Parachlamydia acanthamoebae]EFB40766.1 hypothetical protein pah_c188o010 [Parachlamydia acanthamoebae str. Hall's coccus]CCB86515.1 uncharacterized protein YhiD [Parachlamydia acanthamoebae UV-7]